MANADDLQQAIIDCTDWANVVPNSAEILLTGDFDPGPQTVSSPTVFVVNVDAGKTLTIKSSTSDVRTLSRGNATFDITGPRMFGKTGAGEFVIERVKFDRIPGNEAGQVIAVTAGDLTIIDSQFSGNYSNGTGPAARGGAIFFDDSTASLTISGTTFDGNSSENTVAGAGGGAIYATGGNVRITNSTLTANRAFRGAGGIVQEDDTLVLDFVTMSGNEGSTDFGGNPDASNLQMLAGTLILNGTVIGESATAVQSCSLAGGVSVDDSYSISVETGCGVVDGNSGGAIETAAEIKLGDLTDNGGPTQTMLPGYGSVLRDYAPDALGTGITTDQRGVSRSGLFAVGSVQAFPPQPPCTNPSDFAGGAGLANDPFQVATAQQLAYLGDPSCLALDFELISDIALSGPWTPIWTASAPFAGTLRGNGHSVTGLSVSSGNDDLGLFGVVSGSAVDPALIEDMSVSGTVAGNASTSDYVGGVAGRIDDFTTIDSVRSNVSVSGASYVGGLVGRARKSSSPVGPEIVTSHATGAVDGADDYVGGLVGYLYYGTITGSSASGTVRDDTDTADGGVGGLVGLTYESTVSRSFATGSVMAEERVGALVGHADNNSLIEFSYATGDVDSNPAGDGMVGGLIGFLEDGADVTDSYSTGSVQGKSPETGGLIGRVEYGTVTVSNSYTVSSVSQFAGIGGGLIGTFTPGSISGSFWNPTDAAPATASAAGAESTRTAMRSYALYDDTGWAISETWANFDDSASPSRIWGICPSVNSGFPYLLWEYVADPCSSPNPPAPAFPPSAPRDVTGVPGDRSVVVSWREPESSGSFPVSTYRATASPGGRSCLVSATVTSCDVTGLTNGTPYTFTVQALNGAGWGPLGGPSAPVTPGGVTPAPDPVPVPGPLAPGDSVLQTNGVVDPNVTVDPNTGDNGLVITGDGWTMDLDGLGPDGRPLNLGPDGVLRLIDEWDVATEGTGFLPNSEVDLYVDPPVLVQGQRQGRSAEAIYVGTVITDARGAFAGTATLPESIEPGDHVLQAAGYAPQGTSRALSLGVVVEENVITVPGPVRNIELVKVTAAGTVVLRWRVPSFDGGSPVIAYRVGQRLVGVKKYTRVLPNTTTTRVRITGLTPGKAYWVRIKAGNIVGFGPGTRYAERIRIPVR